LKTILGYAFHDTHYSGGSILLGQVKKLLAFILNENLSSYYKIFPNMPYEEEIIAKS